MDMDGFDQLADLALSKSGQALKRSHVYLIEARLSHILRRENFSNLLELADCLQARPNPGFEEEIVSAMADKKTSFFLERDTLRYIVDTAIPDILKRQDKLGAHYPVQIICAGGGTGQEAYSLAMLLDESDNEEIRQRDIEILSLDMCKASTQRARDGLYGHYEIQMGMSVQRMLKYFARSDNAWKISDDIRDKVLFEVANLMVPLDGLTSADIILCRNVLPNMTAAMATGLAGRLGRLLASEGLLFLGANSQSPAPGFGASHNAPDGTWFFDPSLAAETAAA